MSTTYDVLVLGSGPGGYVAAIRASQLGLKSAVVERESLGGICLNWGCIPTKALLKTAEVRDYFAHANEYGLQAGDVNIDFPAVIKRSRGVADKMSKGVQFLLKKNKVDVLMGEGRLVAKNKLRVTADGKTTEYTAKHVVLAVGGRARELPGLEIDHEKILGYRDAMVLPTIPKSLIVMGSGAIGTEFAHFYNKMGTEVTIVEYADRMMPAADPEVSKAMEKAFKKDGIKFLPKTKVTAADRSGEGVTVTLEGPNGQEKLHADRLLSAVGVVANTAGIGLEELGVELDRGLIKVDGYLQTNVAGLYAIGDCVPGPALAHKASAEGVLVAEHIAGHAVQPLDYGNVPSCVYTQPELAWVGLTEPEAKEQGYDIKVGTFPFTASGKATAAGKNTGFVKLIFDAKYGEFLGAHMIGANVTEMIAEAVVARKLETTGHEIMKSVHPHPTLSEAVMEAAAAAYGEVIHL